MVQRTPRATIDITNVDVVTPPGFQDVPPDEGEFVDVPAEDGFIDVPPDDDTFLDNLGENFKQQFGGIRDATQQALDLFVNKPAAALERAFPLTEKVNEITGLNFPTAIEKSVTLPPVEKGGGTGGAINRGVAQFLTGFIPAMGAAKATGIGTKAANFVSKMGVSIPKSQAIGVFMEAELAALAADQIAFDPKDPRLSNFIQQFPDLQNPITEFLAADPRSTEAENRFKLALEGAGVGAALTVPMLALMRGFRGAARHEAIAQMDEIDLEDVAPRKEDIGSGREEIPAGDGRFAETDEKDLAGNINLDRINSEQDAKDVIRQVADEQAELLEEGRRGVISTEQTRMLASELGMTEAQLLTRRRGQAFNAEEALAARNLLTASAERVVTLGKKAKGGTDEDLVEFSRAMDRHVAIQEQVAGLTAEAGRALRQFQIPAEAARRDEALKNIIEGRGGRDRIEDIARRAGDLDSEEQIAKFTRDVRKARIHDMVIEAWINALLSGPQTHMVNTLSNSLVSIWTIPEHLLAAGFRGVRGGEGVTVRDTAARMFGMVEGMKDGLRAGAKAFITDQPSDIFSKLDQPVQKAIPGKIGEAVRLPGRFLVAEDEFFKTVGYRMEIRSLAMRTGLEKGLKGQDLARHINDVLSDPPEDIALAALDTARYQTFTNPLGEDARHLQGFRNSKNALTSSVSRLLIPFLRTPLNIIKFAGARSPLAPIAKTFREDIKAGGARRDLALARMTMGSGISAVVASLAAEGKITGGGPKDPELRANLFNSRWQPYSLKIGDEYYSYARLEPLGILFGVAADYAAISGQIERGEADDLTANIMFSVAKNLTSKTYLKSISEVVQALHDPDRYGERFIQNLAGTIVPTGVAQIARTQDPILRDAQTSLEKIQSRLPGYSKDLPARRNLWGEPIRMSGGLGPDIISPIYTSTASKDKLTNEMVRLKLEIPMPTRKVRGTELTPQQYWGFVAAAGQPAKAVLDKIVSQPGWDEIGQRPGGNELQEDIIRRTVDQFRELARARLFAETDILQKEAERRVAPFVQ